MADNNKIVDLVELIKNNFSAIQEGTYEWQKEDIDALYKLAHSVVCELDLPFGNEREDVVADIVTDFFADTLRNINIEREEGLSSYIYTTFKWNALSYYNRKFKEYHGKIKLNLDSPIINSKKNNGNSKNLLDVIINREQLIDERVDFNFVKKYYYDEAVGFVKQYPLLKSYYLEGKSAQELSREYDVSIGTIYYRIRRLTEAMKIVLMEKGYTSDNINSENACSDIYKYTERQIMQYGLIYLIYNKKNNLKDIAEALNVDIRTINFAINHLLKNKSEIMESRGIKDSNSYILFTKFYFPQLLSNIENMNKEYKQFADKLFETEEILRLIFKENRTYKEIDEMLNLNRGITFSRLDNYRKKIKLLYKKYKDNNYSFENGNSISNFKNVYERFAEYYFKDLVNTDEITSDSYKQFVDKILETEVILRLRFKENRTSKEIDEMLSLNIGITSRRLSAYREKIKNLYKKYKDNNYSFEGCNSISDLADVYERFAEYYFKDLVNTDEITSDSYKGFVDEILSENKMLYFKFICRMNNNNIAKKLDTNVFEINKQLFLYKEKIGNLYKIFKNKNTSKVQDGKIIQNNYTI